VPPLADQTLLQPWLLAGERILWTGRPQRGLRFRAADVYLIPFSLLWGGFALFWNVEAWSLGAPDLFALWGLPFLAVGIYVVAGRFIHDALLRSALLYAVTTRRVIVLRTRFGRRLSSHEIGHLPVLEYDEEPGGRGTLRFDVDEDSNPFARNNWRIWVPSAARGVRFDRIERPRMVYDLIRTETDRRRVELFGESPNRRDFIG
jgi:hypothetical protein